MWPVRATRETRIQRRMKRRCYNVLNMPRRRKNMPFSYFLLYAKKQALVHLAAGGGRPDKRCSCSCHCSGGNWSSVLSQNHLSGFPSLDTLRTQGGGGARWLHSFPPGGLSVFPQISSICRWTQRGEGNPDPDFFTSSQSQRQHNLHFWCYFYILMDCVLSLFCDDPLLPLLNEIFDLTIWNIVFFLNL